MEIEYNDTLYTEGIKISDFNYSNVDIEFLPYIDPTIDHVINLTKYTFTWNTTKFTRNKLAIKLNFSEPDSISNYITQDQIQISFSKCLNLLKS